MKALTEPSPDDIVQEGGASMTFPEHVKWAEVASKTSIVTTGSSAALANQLQDKIFQVRGRQRKLASVFQEAVIKSIHMNIPEANAALHDVLFCCEVLGKQAKEPKSKAVDWQAHSTTLQKLSEINHRLLFGFDLMGTLGAEIGKIFFGELERMFKFFNICSVMADWLNHGCARFRGRVCLVNFKFHFNPSYKK